MAIERVAEWALGLDDEAGIAGLLARCFDTEFGGRSFFKQRHHLRLLHREAGRIIGHMGLQFRAIRIGADLVTVAGLADVACDAGYRGKGIASGLLAVAMAEARASRAEYFLLFGTAGLYHGAGFRSQINRITYLDLTGALTGEVRVEPAETLMVLQLGEKPWPANPPIDLLGCLF